MKQKQEKLETKMKWMLLSTMIPMTILIIVLLGSLAVELTVIVVGGLHTGIAHISQILQNQYAALSEKSKTIIEVADTFKLVELTSQKLLKWHS